MEKTDAVADTENPVATGVAVITRDRQKFVGWIEDPEDEIAKDLPGVRDVLEIVVTPSLMEKDSRERRAHVGFYPPSLDLPEVMLVHGSDQVEFFSGDSEIFKLYFQVKAWFGRQKVILKATIVEKPPRKD